MHMCVLLASLNELLSCRRETALQGGLVMAKSEDWNSETIFMDIIGLTSTTVFHYLVL